VALFIRKNEGIEPTKMKRRREHKNGKGEVCGPVGKKEKVIKGG